MNKQIKALNVKLANLANDAGGIELELQAEWNKVFAGLTQLRDAVSQVEQSNEYTSNEHGEICSWVRFEASDFKDCHEYLKEYLRDNYCVDLDVKCDALLMTRGDENLTIQDDTRHDNGVWQSGERIIVESEYKNDDGEIDETKRNTLIEAHMEKTGCFPGVFRVDYHGNIFSVNTKG